MFYNNKYNIDDLLQACLGCEQDDLAMDIIISPLLSPVKVERLLHRQDKRFSKTHWWQGVTGWYNERRISVLACRPAAQSVYDLICLLGGLASVPRLIFSGTAGALDPELAVGDCLVAPEGYLGCHPAAAMADQPLSEQSFTHFSAAAGLTAQVAAILEKKYPGKLKKGSICSLSSLWQETTAELSYFASQKIAGVDLEAAYGIAAAHRMKIPLSAVLLISDQPLWQPVWQPLSAQRSKLLQQRFNEWPRLLLEVVAEGLRAEPCPR